MGAVSGKIARCRAWGSELQARLQVICGAANVVTDAHTLTVYRPRVGAGAGAMPLAVALPANATETAACVAACVAAGVAWVPRGAGTWAPASAGPDAVTIAMTRMRRVLTADARTGVVRAEAGVPGRLLQRAFANAGASPPPARVGAPAPPPPPPPTPADAVATLGGLLAAPHAGPRTLADHRLRVLALTLVLPDGSLAELNAGTPGYDLLGAFLGSAGVIGIAVDATVTLAARLVQPTANAAVPGLRA